MGKFKNSHPMFVLERRLSIFFIRAYSVRYSASTTVDWKCKTCLALLYISNSMLNKTLLIVDVMLCLVFEQQQQQQQQRIQRQS